MIKVLSEFDRQYIISKFIRTGSSTVTYQILYVIDHEH